ncbi:hypothetical protein KIN20_032291 [Parelaphostrongylus tenuis]|uniref:Uncharacterized protein n=1 Tax=Parelaphostrongylus tenuis TaxID=148309 RepID=A0AAD5R6S8_PARTN|nr:hypothetical protein KIN20_032291 [Parelaphostrongylus tenuis]
MVYSESTNVRSRYPGIAASRQAAKAFIERLMMQTVFDILEQQGRSALLPDAAITSILDQLKVRISYEPQECKDATTFTDQLKDGSQANPEVATGRHTKSPEQKLRCAVTAKILVNGHANSAMCGRLMREEVVHETSLYGDPFHLDGD